MKAGFARGAVLGTTVALVTLIGSAAVAGTGVGKIFNLGESNRVNARSQLEGATPSAVLNVTNTDKSAPASGVAIDVPASDPPLVVNSVTKVTNLNADLLDGNDSSAFQKQVTGQCATGSMISAVHSDGSVSCSGTGVSAFRDSMNPGDPNITHAFPPSGFEFQSSCPADSTMIGYALHNAGPANGVLDEMRIVAPAQTTSIGGGEMPAGTGRASTLTASQIDARYIWEDAAGILTINVTMINDQPGCTIFGTAQFDPTS